MKPGTFLGYQSQVADLALVAKYLGIRLHPEVSGDLALGNLTTLYPTYRPHDSVIESAVTNLKRIINKPSGALWTDEVQSISANLVERLPAEAIDARDLVQLLVHKHVMPDIAKWAVFEAIESNVLRAIYQVPSFAPHPPRSRRDSVAHFINKKNREISQGDPETACIGKSEVSRVKATLLVWSSTRKARGQQGAPTKYDCTPEVAKQIVEICQQHKRVRYAEVAKTLGIKPEIVKAVYGRYKKSVARKSAKSDRDKPSSR